MRRLSVALLALAVAGCQLLLDFRTGREAAPTTDATAEATSESGVTVDGAGDDGAATPCATGTGAFFCDDFDHGELVEKWTLPSPPAGDAPVLTDAFSVSPPRSMRARVLDGGLPVYAEARLDAPDADAMLVRWFTRSVEGSGAPMNAELRFVDQSEHVTASIHVFVGPNERHAGVDLDNGQTASTPALPYDGGWELHTLDVFFARDGGAANAVYRGYPLNVAIARPTRVDLDLGIRDGTPGEVLVDTVVVSFASAK